MPSIKTHSSISTNDIDMADHSKFFSRLSRFNLKLNANFLLGITSHTKNNLPKAFTVYSNFRYVYDWRSLESWMLKEGWRLRGYTCLTFMSHLFVMRIMIYPRVTVFVTIEVYPPYRATFMRYHCSGLKNAESQRWFYLCGGV